MKKNWKHDMSMHNNNNCHQKWSFETIYFADSPSVSGGSLALFIISIIKHKALA